MEKTRNELLEDILAATVASGIQSPFFIARSSTSIPVSSSSAAPSYVDGLALLAASDAFELVNTGPWAGTGAILNNSGYDLDMIGSFGFFPDNSGTLSRVDFWSERSADGVVITENELSARSVEVTSTTEATQTKDSSIVNWKHGDMLRFAFYDSGGGAISFVQPTVLANGSENVLGPSFSWQLATVRATQTT